MFDQRDEKSIENFCLARIGHTAGDFEECHAAEIDLAKQLVRQVIAADGDLVGSAEAHLGAQRLSFFHGSSLKRGHLGHHLARKQP